MRPEARHRHDVQTRRTDGALPRVLSLRVQFGSAIWTADAIRLAIKLLAELPRFENVDRHQHLRSAVGALLASLSRRRRVIVHAEKDRPRCLRDDRRG